VNAPARLLATALLALALCGCDPHYNWRDYRSQDAPYAVLMPGKPATHTRAVQLGDSTVAMTMAAAEVDDVVFAVGSATLAEAAQAPAALAAMQAALVRNIGAVITSEASAVNGAVTTISVAAQGTRNGQPALLIGRFIAHDRRIYQVVVMGAERHFARDQAATFLDSFKQQ